MVVILFLTALQLLEVAVVVIVQTQLVNQAVQVAVVHII
jgi:hypothetical protein